MPEAQGIIGHGIRLARNVVVERQIRVVALMEATQTKKVGNWIARSDGAALGTRDSRGIVIECGGGPFPYVILLDQDVLVRDDTRQFKIAVGKVARWIRPRNQSLLDVRRKLRTPQKRSTIRYKPHTPHAGA